MVPALSLWLPILLSAVFVFIASSIIHMVFKYHCNDMKALPKEDEIMDALQPFDIEPGEYFMPYINDIKQRETDEFKARLAKGPVAFLAVVPDAYNMGGKLFMWFVYSLLVGLFTAYIAGIALAPGAHYLAVFRITGAVAFVGYSLALIQNSIWYGRGWGSTGRYLLDGFIYALVTAGAFGWLWP